MGGLAAFILEVRSTTGFSGSIKLSCSGGPRNFLRGFSDDYTPDERFRAGGLGNPVPEEYCAGNVHSDVHGRLRGDQQQRHGNIHSEGSMT